MKAKLLGTEERAIGAFGRIEHWRVYKISCCRWLFWRLPSPGVTYIGPRRERVYDPTHQVMEIYEDYFDAYPERRARP